MDNTATIRDYIEINNKIYSIAKIINQYYSNNPLEKGYFIEFIDDEGNYHYWKQYSDGGKLIKKKGNN